MLVGVSILPKLMSYTVLIVALAVLVLSGLLLRRATRNKNILWIALMVSLAVVIFILVVSYAFGRGGPPAEPEPVSQLLKLFI